MNRHEFFYQFPHRTQLRQESWLVVLIIFAMGQFFTRLQAQGTPESFAYVLQADGLAKSKGETVEILKNCNRDWIVLDRFFTSGEPWTQSDLETIRRGKIDRKMIVYVSIGEAEDYREYWNKTWTEQGLLTHFAPTWLNPENPKWKGNYPVKYWQSGWQAIILSTLDELINVKFDGIYLDIVDGFENFEHDGKKWIPNKLNPETQQSYRRDMVDWVKTIATRLRSKNAEAFVIPQNGAQLLEYRDFLLTISAIGIEDLFTNGKKPQSKAHTEEVLKYLAYGRSEHKNVLLIEYPKKDNLRESAIQNAKAQKMVWLMTDRALKTLGSSGR